MLRRYFSALGFTARSLSFCRNFLYIGCVNDGNILLIFVRRKSLFNLCLTLRKEIDRQVLFGSYQVGDKDK